MLLLVTADHATGAFSSIPPSPSARAICPAKMPGSKRKKRRPRGKRPGAGRERGCHQEAGLCFTHVYPDEDVSYGTAGHTNELVDLAIMGARPPRRS